ncbi:MAG: hypothetical protein WAX44_00650 [Minisyncoccia bacterium]
MQTNVDQVEKLKNKLIGSRISGLALDIDETLADSNTHWFENMFKFHAPEGLNLKDVMSKHKFVEEVPEWSTVEAFEFMQEMLHSEEFNESVPLIEDSNHIVNKIDKLIPIVAYITARPSTVINATNRWLKRHDFPAVDLITRPHDIQATVTDIIDRNKWKAKILIDLFPYVSGIIDDNLLLAQSLDDLGYKGTLYLYGTKTTKFDHMNHVITCPTWNDVLDNIVK